ncbi:MAG: hypothetical protein WC457_04445 [Patescibacteria group bacterium]
MDKRVIMLGMVVGSTIGGYLPTIFGAGIFSLYSILGTVLGGVLGIWLSFKLFN